MQPEKLNVVFPDGSKIAELIIREGSAMKILDPKAPIKIKLSGVIGTPYEFLLKRSETKQIIPDKCHIIVDRENVSITLITNEDDEYLTGSIVGQLTKHPKFIEFGINNSEKVWEANKLGQFLKMNRSFFVSRDENMSLVTLLKNFVGNIASKYEKQNSENGEFKDNFSGFVTTNLPPSFMAKIPIFKGVVPEEIEIEFYVGSSGREVFLQLQSPVANELFESIRDEAIDKELDLIKSLCPMIAIIEK